MYIHPFLPDSCHILALFGRFRFRFCRFICSVFYAINIATVIATNWLKFTTKNYHKLDKSLIGIHHKSTTSPPQLLNNFTTYVLLSATAAIDNLKCAALYVHSLFPQAKVAGIGFSLGATVLILHLHCVLRSDHSLANIRVPFLAISSKDDTLV